MILSHFSSIVSKFQVEIHLPVDVVTGDKFDAAAAVGAATIESGIPDDWMVTFSIPTIYLSCTYILIAHILHFAGSRRWSRKSKEIRCCGCISQDHCMEWVSIYALIRVSCLRF